MASKYVKWVGGGLGWALGGPIGALMGFVLGALFDNADDQPLLNEGQGPAGSRYRQDTPGSGDFYFAVLVLSAAVMKADGRQLKSELDYIKQFLKTNFGSEKTREYLQVLKRLLDTDIPLRQVALQITQHTSHAARLQLMHYLYGIAAADGHVDKREQDILHQIAGYLNISPADAASIKAMFVKDTGNAYKVLEIDQKASPEEIKKAYRKMAMKHHPDKVSDLGEDAVKAAQEKFNSIKEAYDQIKKERGMS